MRPGLKLFLATVLAALLVVPVAGAKPGNGNGNGNGGGKPSWAGQGKATAEAAKAANAQRKLERRAAASDESAEGEEQEAPGKDNPAFVCKSERDAMGEEAFVEAYGENENGANAFGKCVSQEAQERDDEAEDGDDDGEGEGLGSIADRTLAAVRVLL
jgi:hypothetical protein